MNIDQLRGFLAVAEGLNITKAAARQHITQSVLSKRIMSLENDFGFTLFKRTASGITLTSAGLLAYDLLKPIVNDFDDAMEKVQHLSRHISGDLHIGQMLQIKTHEKITAAFQLFRKQYPQIALSQGRYTLRDLLFALEEGDVDIAAIWLSEIEEISDIQYEIIGEIKYGVIVSVNHPMAGRKECPLSAFRDDYWLLPTEADAQAFYKRMNVAFDKAGFTPRRFRAAGFEAMDFVSDGYGIAVSNADFTLTDLPAVSFISVPEIKSDAMTLAWHKANKSPLLTEFLTVLRSGTTAVKD
jgi:DNA-binding transcriptional LysR family regulator